jgi:hypothetical protein
MKRVIMIKPHDIYNPNRDVAPQKPIYKAKSSHAFDLPDSIFKRLSNCKIRMFYM